MSSYRIFGVFCYAQIVMSVFFLYHYYFLNNIITRSLFYLKNNNNVAYIYTFMSLLVVYLV